MELGRVHGFHVSKLKCMSQTGRRRSSVRQSPNRGHSFFRFLNGELTNVKPVHEQRWLRACKISFANVHRHFPLFSGKQTEIVVLPKDRQDFCLFSALH